MTGRDLLDKLYRGLASYGLACILLALLFLLTFLGTIEQTRMGLLDVQHKYFDSWFLVHDLAGAIPLPLPGAYLVMALLTVNLVLGGLVRIRKDRQTAGVIVIHVGILILVGAGLVKGMASREGNLLLAQRGRVDELERYVQQRHGFVADYVDENDEFESYHEWEVAVWDAAQRSEVEEWIVGQEDFAGLTGDAARTFHAPELPFALRLSHYVRNGRPLPKGPMWTSATPVFDGIGVKAEAPNPDAERNVPALVVTALEGGQPVAEALVWGEQRVPLAIEVDGRQFGVDLRKRRYRLPFTVRLDEFRWELYPRTGIPKTYESNVTRIDDGVETPVKISMNQPLRHMGYTLYQSSYGPGQDLPQGAPAFSVFAVVRNPSDQWPLYGCLVITLGLLITYGQRLARYSRRQAAKRRAGGEAAAVAVPSDGDAGGEAAPENQEERA